MGERWPRSRPCAVKKQGRVRGGCGPPLKRPDELIERNGGSSQRERERKLDNEFDLVENGPGSGRGKGESRGIPLSYGALQKAIPASRAGENIEGGLPDMIKHEVKTNGLTRQKGDLPQQTPPPPKRPPPPPPPP